MSVILRREVYLEFRCHWMGDHHYPKSTEHASSERMTRGCDSNVTILNYLIKQGRVQPNRNPRNDERPADDINHTALGFEDQNPLTPEAHAILWQGIHADVYPPNYSSVSQSIAIPGSWGTRCGALGPTCSCRRVSVGLAVLVRPAVSEVLAASGYLPWSTP